MLTPKRPAEARASWVLRLFSTQTSTSGGWRESDANDDTVMPYGFPSCSVVTIVTPLAKCDMACLKSASVTGIRAGVYCMSGTSTEGRRAKEEGRRGERVV